MHILHYSPVFRVRNGNKVVHFKNTTKKGPEQLSTWNLPGAQLEDSSLCQVDEQHPLNLRKNTQSIQC